MREERREKREGKTEKVGLILLGDIILAHINF